MKQMLIIILSFLLLVAVVTILSFGEEMQGITKSGSTGTAAVSLPKPAPELEQLKFFLGKWQCDSREFASPRAPEHGFKATFVISTELDGFWIMARYEEKASRAHPFARKNVEL